MLDQRSEDDPPKNKVSEEDRDKCVLHLMIYDPWPWTVDEIARELHPEIGAADAVRRLEGAGLLRRLGECVIPTRAARRADEIYLGSS